MYHQHNHNMQTNAHAFVVRAPIGQLQQRQQKKKINKTTRALAQTLTNTNAICQSVQIKINKNVETAVVCRCCYSPTTEIFREKKKPKRCI